MKNKEPDWFISSLRWSFAAIVLILLFLGVYSFIYYSEMDYTGKVSSGFSFLSSLSIFVTIIIYSLQKKSDSKKQKTKNHIINRILIDSINQKTNTMTSILKFNDDVDYFNKKQKITSIYAVKISNNIFNLMASSNDTDILCHPVVIYSNERMLEAMLNRYITSHETSLITEELNNLIIEIDNFTNTHILNTFSRIDFPHNIKLGFLTETKKGGRYDYITKLDEINKKIIALN